MHYNHTYWLELDTFFLDQKIIDQNFISIDTNTSPLTVRTAIWRFGLITNHGIDRMIDLNFPYASYYPMRLS